LYFFHVVGNYYWKLSPDGFLNSYPLLISHHWAELPGNIDAAFATSSGTTYFFKGAKYWVYTYRRLHPGHPKLISEGWPGIPNNIDAATWYTGSVFYFFKGKFANDTVGYRVCLKIYWFL
jgi:hypothetical protein